MSNHTQDHEHIHTLIDILSKKWMLHIFHVFVFSEQVRFNEIKDNIDGISSKMLSQRLSELEQYEFITRTVKNEKPVIISYSATQKTKDLIPIFHEFFKWSQKWTI